MARYRSPFLLLCLAAGIAPSAEAALWLKLRTGHMHEAHPVVQTNLKPYISTYDAAYTFVGIANESGIATAPVTFTTRVPTGFTVTRFVADNWQCTQNGQDVSCVSIADIPTPQLGSDFQPIPPPQGQIRIYYDISPTLAPNTPFNLRGAAGNAANPHDPNGNCDYWNSCLEENSLVLESWLKPSLSFTGSPSYFVPGTERPLTFLADIRGYNVNNGAAAYRMYLPRHVSYDHIVFTTPTSGWSCAPAALGTGRTRLDCSTPALHNATTEPYGASIGGALFLDLDPATTVPGSVDIFVTFENADQPAPEDCYVDPIPKGCARITIPVDAAPAPRLIVERVDPTHPHGISRSPNVFNPGGAQVAIALHYLNTGNATAATPQIDVRLPAGLAYVSASNSAPAVSCTATGNVATGQTLRCAAQSLGTSPNHRGRLELVLQPMLSLPIPSTTITGAVRLDGSITADAMLSDCEATPGQVHCARAVVPVVQPSTCVGLPENEGLYCDGFEER
jgi:hypothetical protein